MARRIRSHPKQLETPMIHSQMSVLGPVLMPRRPPLRCFTSMCCTYACHCRGCACKTLANPCLARWAPESNQCVGGSGQQGAGFRHILPTKFPTGSVLQRTQETWRTNLFHGDPRQYVLRRFPTSCENCRLCFFARTGHRRCTLQPSTNR